MSQVHQPRPPLLEGGHARIDDHVEGTRDRPEGEQAERERGE